jgi:Icc protein
MPFTLAQLSDPHLVADPAGAPLGYPVREALGTVVAATAQDAPGAALVTGDLSQDGTPASYAALGEALRPLEAPCYAVPGNHDDSKAMRAALSEEPFRASRSFEAGGWRALLLDSPVAGETHGRLSGGALAELGEALAARPETPTLLGLHHPPVPPGSAWLDPLGLHDPGPFLETIAAHEQVRLVLFGHIHQVLDRCHAQARLLGCPATCFQFRPGAKEFALDPERAPGYRRVELFRDGTFTTSVERLSRAYALDTDASGC